MIVAIALAALLMGLVGFQVALASGAPWGRAAYGGGSALLTTRLRVASAVAAILWAGAAIIVLGRGGVLEVAFSGILIWFVVGLLALGIVPNSITRSRIERAIWLPFSVVATALAVIVALG
jgi:hypothetical protein